MAPRDPPCSCDVRYNASTLHNAWGKLIDAAVGCNETSPAFIFDLVDVGREYLSIAPCQSRAKALQAAKSDSDIVAANASMATLMADLDSLLATSDGFLLGRWIHRARALATDSGDAADADFLEWNARAQVTSWFPENAEGCSGDAKGLDGLWDCEFAELLPRAPVHARSPGPSEVDAD